MKGISVANALKCAAKVKAGKKCSVSELAGSLDTLAWAYNRVKKPVRKGAKKINKFTRLSTRARSARKKS